MSDGDSNDRVEGVCSNIVEKTGNRGTASVNQVYLQQMYIF